MYTININGSTVVQGDGVVVIDPVLTEAVNTSGSLTYSIPYNDSNYDTYAELQTTVQVYDPNKTEPIFAGRLLSSKVTLYGTKELEFEGDMSLLNDVLYPPYDYSGDVRPFLQAIIDYYNSRCSTDKQITLGSVTVTDPNGYIARSNTDFSSCWETISEKLVKILGGYVKIRYSEDGSTRYLDYLLTPGLHNTQKVEFGKNLLDIENYIDAAEVATVLIPLGATSDDSTTCHTTAGRVDIVDAEDNTSGLNYITTSFADTLGKIETVAKWDDVSDPDNLYTKALAYAEEMVTKDMTISISVVDLHLTDTTIEEFSIGDTIDCVSAPHNLSVTMMMTERERHLNDPSQDNITLGTEQETYTASSNNRIVSVEESVKAQTTINAELIEKIADAKGLHTTIETDESGAQIIWLHEEDTLEASNLRMKFSTAGCSVTGDGGSTWYGFTFNGDWWANLVKAYKISADYIEGGTIEGVTFSSDASGTGSKTIISDGSIYTYGKKDGESVLIGEIDARGTDPEYVTYAIDMSADNANAMAFGRLDSAGDASYYYVINHGRNPDNYTERHIFYGTSRFTNTINANGEIKSDGITINDFVRATFVDRVLAKGAKNYLYFSEADSGDFYTLNYPYGSFVLHEGVYIISVDLTIDSSTTDPQIHVGLYKDAGSGYEEAQRLGQIFSEGTSQFTAFVWVASTDKSFAINVENQNTSNSASIEAAHIQIMYLGQ